MRQFDFYEFAGLVVPGTAMLAALTTFFPGLDPAGSGLALSYGNG